MKRTAVSEFDVGLYESDEEIQRFAEAKRIRWWVAEIFFTFLAFSAARKCTKDYINAVNAGGTNVSCSCGYHPSRRKIKTVITEETAANDLRNIADKFCIIGEDNETRRSADILLQVLNTAREELKQPKFLMERYLDSAVRSEKLPKLVSDIIKYVHAGEITAKQADNALIEIKGRYQKVFREMGINPTPVPISEK